MSYNIEEVKSKLRIPPIDKDILKILNSLTKYPSIPTYHQLGPKGGCIDDLVDFAEFGNFTIPGDHTPIVVTEKIDGTNTRIILSNDDCTVGSREEILYAAGDRILNPTMGIVETVFPFASWCLENGVFHELKTIYLDNQEKPMEKGSFIFVIYGETFGSNIGSNGNKYSNTSKMFRIFDIRAIPTSLYFNLVHHFRQFNDLDKVCTKAANYRDKVPLGFFSRDLLQVLPMFQNKNAELVPTYCVSSLKEIGKSPREAYEWLKTTCPSSKIESSATPSYVEGVVARTYSRSWIAKLRFEDYKKGLGIK